MIVEVDDQDARARRESRLIRARGNRDVVEEAEAHAAIGLGMVPGRTHQREDRLVSRNACLGGDDCAAGGATCDAIGRRVDDRIAGREIARFLSPSVSRLTSSR